MSNESSVNSLIAGVEFDDPRLKSALDLLVKDVYTVYNQLNPPTTGRNLSSTGAATSLADVTGFNITVEPRNIRLDWDSLDGFYIYEVRYGSTWDTATTLLKTNTSVANLNPVDLPATVGTHTFLVKATNILGQESVSAASNSFTLTTMSAPIVTTSVVDNNVLLYWTTPSNLFAISYFNIYKDSVLSGTMNGTFEAIFENIAGSYTYAVEAVDIIGNVSVLGSVLVDVKQPPDYEILDSQISTLSGTLVNAIKEDLIPNLVVCLDTTQSYSNHFSTRSYNSPQDQIDAGFPYFMQPNLTTASYEEVIDYGSIISNTIATVIWTSELIAGSVTATPKMAGSTNGSVYTSWTTSSSVFFSSLRYLKVHFDFAATSSAGLLVFSNLNIILDVKREVDGGSLDIAAADSGGTEVTFNKSFLDVESITLDSNSLEPVILIYDFTDVPNPTSFFALAFDTAGNRIDASISWKARGIV